MSEEAKGSNKFSDEESQRKVKSKRREGERKTRRREKKCDCQLRRTNNIGVTLCACIHILPVCVLLEFSAAMAERWGRLPWWPLNRAPKYSHVQLTPSRSTQPQRHVMYTWEGTFCCLFLSSAIRKRSTCHGNQYSVTASVIKCWKLQIHAHYISSHPCQINGGTFHWINSYCWCTQPHTVRLFR